MLQSLVPPLHLPRARIEPIRTAGEALSVVSLAVSRPLREELVVVTCDRRGAGHSLAVFDVHARPEALAHDVVGHASSSPFATGVIAAHVRPTHDGLQHALVDCLEKAGLALLHFFTVHHGEVSAVGQ